MIRQLGTFTLFSIVSILGCASFPIQLRAESLATSTPQDPRGEERTFASFPEWYIVYSAEEYADFVQNGGRPSQFPYFKAISQYWESVENASQALGNREVDPSTNSVLQFIGVSFTLENALIGAYEKTVGRMTEAFNFFRKTGVDRYIDGVAREYGEFLLYTPWYDFPYFEKLSGLWKTFSADDIFIRGIERRLIFSLGYIIKGTYGKIIGKVSHSSLGYAELKTRFTAEDIARETLEKIPTVEILDEKNGRITAEAPRYRAFKPVAEAIARAGGRFVDIQGNKIIMLTLIAPADNTCVKKENIVFSMPILTRPLLYRFALQTSVQELDALIQKFDSCELPVEHIYDY